MIGFFSFLKAPSLAEPGRLIDLARQSNKLLAQFGASGGAESNAQELFEHRLALARSQPATALDLLMLVLSARQAAMVLETTEHRAYWVGELDDALLGIQTFLEANVGSTLAELGFTVEKGAMTLN